MHQRIPHLSRVHTSIACKRLRKGHTKAQGYGSDLPEARERKRRRCLDTPVYIGLPAQSYGRDSGARAGLHNRGAGAGADTRAESHDDSLSCNTRTEDGTSTCCLVVKRAIPNRETHPAEVQGLGVGLPDRALAGPPGGIDHSLGLAQYYQG